MVFFFTYQNFSHVSSKHSLSMQNSWRFYVEDEAYTQNDEWTDDKQDTSEQSMNSGTTTSEDTAKK